MSVVNAIVQATVSPSPSASPLVQAVQAVHAHAVTAASTSPAPWQPLLDWLNQTAKDLSPYIAMIGVAVAYIVQYFVNKFPWLSHEIAQVQNLRRRVVALLLALGVSVSVGSAADTPLIFLGTQILQSVFSASQGVARANTSTSNLAAEEPALG